MIGSRQMGGADQFYCRLLGALHAAGAGVLAVNRAGSPIAQALTTTPVEQIHLPLANSWDAWSLWRLRRLIRSRAPQVVQTYMGRATRLTRVPAASGAAHIARLGGYYKIDGYYRHAHAWVGNTKGLCDYLVSQGLPASRVFQIGNFVPQPVAEDTARDAALREHWSLPGDALVLLALGRLIGIKAYDDLLRAIALLPAQIQQRPLYLMIAGDGPLRDELRSLAQSLGVEARVRWLGWQDKPGALFRLADWVVCPSRYETLGNVILEAWSYAKPVIATTSQGAAELIRDEHDGLLTPCNDPAALARRIQQALDAPTSEAQRIAAAGQAKLAAEFSQAAIVQKYLDLYALAPQLRASSR